MELILQEAGQLATREEAWDRLDRMEAEMLQAGGGGKELFPLKHTFTPGIYTRMIYMPAGSWITSEVHETQHQYIILTGIVSVWTYEKGWVTIEAPYHGITEPGTRRVLYIHEDTAWMTIHANPDNLDTAEAIGEQILTKRHNPYLQTLECHG